MKDQIAKSCTILLVDDEREILEMLVEELAPSFRNVICANNGLEAIEKLTTNEVDLVVTDYIMPQMDGLSLIEYIKDNYPLMPVLMLTSNGNNREVQHALMKGAFDILDKPYRTNVLINRIRNGLILPELLKTIWALMGKEISGNRLKDFAAMPINEQHEMLYAFCKVLQMRNIVASNK